MKAEVEIRRGRWIRKIMNGGPVNSGRARTVKRPLVRTDVANLSAGGYFITWGARLAHGFWPSIG